MVRVRVRLFRNKFLRLGLGLGLAYFPLLRGQIFVNTDRLGPVRVENRVCMGAKGVRVRVRVRVR